MHAAAPTAARHELHVELLRAVQDVVAAQPWLLALPELASFRDFVVSTAAQCQNGEADSMIEDVRQEIRASLETASDEQVEDRLRARAVEALSVLQLEPTAAPAQDPQVAAAPTSPAAESRSPGPKRASTGAEKRVSMSDVDGATSAAGGGPRRLVRGYTQHVRMTSGPCVHLLGVQLAADLLREVTSKEVGLSVLMWMVDSRGRCIGGVVSWPVKETPARDGGLAVKWNSARQLTCGAQTDATMSLRVELWLTGREKEMLLGLASVPAPALTQQLTSFALCRPEDAPGSGVLPPARPVEPRPGQSTVSMYVAKAVAPHKRVFFVRHGESRWNEAQAKRDVVKMVSQVDHPLNEVGYQQASTLALAMATALEEGGGELASADGEEAALLASLRSVNAVWSSPLTRAAQTALLGLAPLLERLRLPIELKPNAREKKNLGGRDTIGMVTGAECGERCLAMCGQFASAAELEALGRVAFDPLEVETQWWVTAAESKESVRGRIQEMLHQIQFSPHDTLVVVGHSHYFRAMFQMFLHPDASRREPSLARKLREELLPNCGIAACELDFSRGPRMITYVRPLLAAPTPLGKHALVVQRQHERLAGPLLHLLAAKNVPHREGLGRPAVRMWLADSSGVNTGRSALWNAAEAQREIHGARPTGWIGPTRRGKAEKADKAGEAGSKVCVWNVARQLGQSHWDTDTVLHVEFRDDIKDELLAKAEVPLSSVEEEIPLELAATAVLPAAAGSDKKTAKREAQGAAAAQLRELSHPVALTLWRVPPPPTVKHLFILTCAESSLGSAVSAVKRAAGRRVGEAEGDGAAPSEVELKEVGGEGGSPEGEAASPASPARTSARTSTRPGWLRGKAGDKAEADGSPEPKGSPGPGGGKGSPEPSPGAKAGRLSRFAAARGRMSMGPRASEFAGGDGRHSKGEGKGEGQSRGLREKLGSMMEQGGEAYRRIKEVAKRTDHPVSKAGFGQAMGVRTAIEAALHHPELLSRSEAAAAYDPDDPPEKPDTHLLCSLLLGAQAVWTSPLARAVQTALIAFQPLAEANLTPRGQPLQLELKANARERREYSTLTTSIGNSCGEHIRSRCMNKLRETRPDEAAVVAELERMRLSTVEADAQWWSTNPEPEKEYSNRTADLLAQLQFCSQQSIALVAHSDTVQELLSRHMGEDAREKHAELVSRITSAARVPHCSLLWCCLDFRRGDGSQPIADVALLGDALAGLARQQPNDPTNLAPRRFSTVADFANFNSSRSRAWSQEDWISGRGSQEEF